MATALLVVADKTSLTTADQDIKDILEETATVTVASDEDAAPTAGTYDLVVIQESVISGTVGSKYLAETSGVVCFEWAVADDFNLTSDTTSRQASTDSLVLNSTATSLKGGLSGTVDLSSYGSPIMQYVNSKASGVKALGYPSGQSSDFWGLYCYSGDTLTSGTADGRRVLFGLQAGDLIENASADFLKLIRQAFWWASEAAVSTDQGGATVKTINKSESYFDFDASSEYLSTADAAKFDITGDLEVIVLCAADNWNDSTQRNILGKWGTGGDRSYKMVKTASGGFQFSWYDGSGTNFENIAAPGFTNGQAYFLRITMDVNRGDGNYEVKFWHKDASVVGITSDPGDITWGTADATDVGSGTTSINSGNAALRIGEDVSADNVWDGKIYAAWLYDGIGGTLVADPDFRTNVQGDWSSSPTTDGQSNSWATPGATYTPAGGDYTTIAAWEAATPAQGEEIWKGVIQDAVEYNENITMGVASGTPSATSYQWLTANSTVRHSGKAGTDHARMRGSTNGSHVILINDSYARVDWLEIQQDSTGSSDEGIRIDANLTDILIDYCIIWSDTDTDEQDGIYVPDGGAVVTTRFSVSNTIVYGFRRAQINFQAYSVTGRHIGTVNVDHCTLINQTGTASTTDTTGGIHVWSQNASDDIIINVHNTIAYIELGTTYEGFSDGKNSPNWRGVPVGTVTWNGSHNLRGDLGTQNEIDGTNNLTNHQYATDGDSESTQSSGSYVVFADITSGTEDFRLLDDAAGNLAAGNGTNRQGSEPDARQDFSVDIEGDARPTTSVDIGAHQVSSTVTLTQARPDADVAGFDGWETYPTASQSYYAQVDEAVASDTDYIKQNA